MSEEASDSWLQFSRIGGIALISGVVCCIGLKVIGGVVLFGGIAATLGITTDQTTFLVGGTGGLAFAGVVLIHRKYGIVSIS